MAATSRKILGMLRAPSATLNTIVNTEISTAITTCAVSPNPKTAKAIGTRATVGAA